MRNLFLGALLLLCSRTTFAQRRVDDDTLFYRRTPVPAHLRPIEVALGSSALSSVYYYGGKRLNSPYSLEVPFYELDDPTVNRHFRNFRTWVTVSRLTGLATLAYALLGGTRSRGAYWTVFGGSLATGVAFTVIGNVQVNKAVRRYNYMLQQNGPRVGVVLTPGPTGRPVPGVGLVGRF